jgi:hypothetical protein
MTIRITIFAGSFNPEFPTCSYTKREFARAYTNYMLGRLFFQYKGMTKTIDVDDIYPFALMLQALHRNPSIDRSRENEIFLKISLEENAWRKKWRNQGIYIAYELLEYDLFDAYGH